MPPDRLFYLACKLQSDFTSIVGGSRRLTRLTLFAVLS